jgi:cytochrome c-type biogenesis protein CcmH
MLLFWIIAALMAAAASALMLVFARRAAGGGGRPHHGLFRRQLAEVDEMAARGLLSGGEREAARAEAGRRLLRAADRRPPRTGRARPWLLPAAAGAAPMAAMGSI